MKKIFAIILCALLLTSCNAVVPMLESSSENVSEASSVIIITSVPDISKEASEPQSSESPSDEPSEEPASEPVTEESTASSAEVIQDFTYKIDITPYISSICPDDPLGYALLVNYDNMLGSDYAPKDLVDSAISRVGTPVQKLRAIADRAMTAMLEEAKADGCKNLALTSGYRSYAFQKWLFAKYVDQYRGNFETLEDTERYVKMFSCKEGCSEHQTGLSGDVHNLLEANIAFGDTYEGKWLADNCWRFGFILRFPKGKEAITGIQYEPWHFRFVGRDLATFMYYEDICLEELYSGDYFEKFEKTLGSTPSSAALTEKEES